MAASASETTSARPAVLDAPQSGAIQPTTKTKAMVIKAEIQRVEKLEFPDKQNPGQKVSMYQLILGDKSKHFRCTTPMIMTVKAEKFRKEFGGGRPSDAVDERVTVAVQEMTARNAFIAIRGQIVKGEHTAEAIEAMVHPDADEIPMGSAGSSTSPAPAKSAAGTTSK